MDPEDNRDPEEISQEMDGRWIEREQEWVLKYTEEPGTPDEVRTTVKAGEEEVTIIRQGMIAYRQRYHPGETTICVVETPGGSSEMEVHTLAYRRERKEMRGQIQFSFRLRMAGEPMGRYQLLIQWTEVPDQA
ncbi:DUF1934 domain-containing protein [Kroppenstedtia sanguinis]|uniref:DUF1934 domain-containing protein n=1 Tax=Kroppenstedtia sanguinis TaxID=1380684 RepID=A0ABW4C9W2_9BACL